MSLEVGPASPGDLEAVRAMLAMARLPLAGFDAARHVWVAREGPVVVGAVALERHGGSGLLRSLVVTPNHRGKGIGRRLLRHAVEAAREGGATDVYALTTTIAPWLESEGWRPIGRAAFPRELEASEELRGACPDSAACFHLRL